MDDAMNTLEGWIGERARAVPSVIAAPEAYHEFSADTLPLPPEQLTTGQIYIERGISEYDEYVIAEKVIFFAHKEAFRQLALLILAVVFHPECGAVRLHLTHSTSVFKTLIISCEGQPFSRWEILRTQAVSFTYTPGEVLQYPWHDLPLSPAELPCFYLRADPARRSVRAGERRPEPEIVAGFGSDRGCVRLAQLLLNLSRPENSETDVRLESEAGWRGVGRKSVEARFALPGSYLWDAVQWPSS